MAEELLDLLRDGLPITLTLTKKDGTIVKIYFHSLQGVRDFNNLVLELIEKVKKKTLEEPVRQ